MGIEKIFNYIQQNLNEGCQFEVMDGDESVSFDVIRNEVADNEDADSKTLIIELSDGTVAAIIVTELDRL